MLLKDRATKETDLLGNHLTALTTKKTDCWGSLYVSAMAVVQAAMPLLKLLKVVIAQKQKQQQQQQQPSSSLEQSKALKLANVIEHLENNCELALRVLNQFSNFEVNFYLLIIVFYFL